MIIFNYDGKSTFSFKNKEDKNIENIIPKELKGIKVKIWAISEERDFNIEYENGIFYHNGLKNRNINELMEQVFYNDEMEKEIQKY
ncbi:hypothetical protein [Leptotrichia hongkongensis]|uniref:hypothetical protein n=1 Tax=Leptotrichia hongkongensis TaxID=554406 RepID=UPI0035A930DB